jgi:replicative DNA helicase
MDNLNWEKTLLGSVIYDPACYPEAQHLAPHDFEGCHKDIWRGITDLANRNALTERNLIEWLRTENKLVMLGDGQLLGEDYICSLSDTSDPNGIVEQARQVEEYATKRHIRELGYKIIGETANGKSSEDIIVDYTKRLMEMRRKVEDVMPIGALSAEFDERMQALIHGGTLRNWKPPLEALANKIGYLDQDDFVLIPGRPGWGKSSLLRSQSIETALHNDGVLMFNFENSKISYYNWAVAHITGIDSYKLKFPKRLSPAEMEQIDEAKKAINLLPIYIKDAGFNSLNDVINISRKLVLSKNIKVIMLDYLQLISGVGERYEQVLSAAQGLRNLAKELCVPIIAAAQLNREVDSRKDKRPQLGDIAYAGEQPSKHVWAPWIKQLSDSEYGAFPENRVGARVLTKDDARAVVIQLLILKNSNGPTGETGEIKWDKATDTYLALEEGWRRETPRVATASFAPAPKPVKEKKEKGTLWQR